MTGDIPPWFSAALAAPVEDGSVDVDGARIRYRAWGNRGARGAVLVHGGAAHARWWDHVGPQLSAGLRVVALDLSGHGDSAWREQYSLECWAAEVVAVAADAGVSGAPFVIGHSMGGAVALRAAAIYGDALAGIVVVDTPMFEALPEPQDVQDLAIFGTERTYPSREAALARFRLVPDHPVLAYVRDHVAAWSVGVRGDGEWGWKFDRGVFTRAAPGWSLMRHVDCRVAILRAQNGIMTTGMAQLLREGLGQESAVVELPAAGHHVMLDEPLCLVTAVRTLLSDWAQPAFPQVPAA